MADIATRPWCGVIAFGDKTPIRVGTIRMPVSAHHAEIMAAFMDRCREHFPAGFRLIDMVPGAIFFVPEESLTKAAEGS